MYIELRFMIMRARLRGSREELENHKHDVLGLEFAIPAYYIFAGMPIVNVVYKNCSLEFVVLCI